MQTAEAMEQTGRESAVHASESFVRALWAGAGLTGALCSGGAVGDGSGASDGWLSGRFSGEGDDASPFKGGLLADEDDSDDDSHAEQAADDSILGAAGPTWHVPPEVSVHSATLTSKLLGLSRSGGSWIRHGFLLPRAGSASSSGSVTGPIAPSRWLTGGMPKRAPLAGVVVETPRSPSPWATTGTLHVRGDGEDAGEGRDGRRASWSELPPPPPSGGDAATATGAVRHPMAAMLVPAGWAAVEVREHTGPDPGSGGLRPCVSDVASGRPSIGEHLDVTAAAADAHQGFAEDGRACSSGGPPLPPGPGGPFPMEPDEPESACSLPKPAERVWRSYLLVPKSPMVAARSPPAPPAAPAPAASPTALVTASLVLCSGPADGESVGGVEPFRPEGARAWWG